MSKIKPVAWVNPQFLPKSYDNYTATFLRPEKDREETLPLYTADQLAEAVAAERERCAKMCEILGGIIQSGYIATAYDPENRGADCAEDMAERCAEAIRSAAK